MLAKIDGRRWFLTTRTHKNREYIVAICLEDTIKYYVPLPHPGYKDGQWQKDNFLKIIRTGDIMARASRGRKSA